MNLTRFEEEIKYKFKNIQLLENALTHTSYAYEHNKPSNEKLEFLGDSVLEVVSSNYIYNHYQYLNEGEMTKVRASVVCEKSLYKIAIEHKFGEYLYLGRSELHTGGKNKPAILADSVEAVIAAIYLDGGIEKATEFIINNLKDAISIATKEVGKKDYKSVLQEKLQIHGDVKIRYEIVSESGPDNNKTFEAEVSCNGKYLAKGMGTSKKKAEMDAARIALENLK